MGQADPEFGIQEDSETGLKLMGHRYCDPGTGRFITRDSIGNGTNWYKYADNNPLKQVDPSGLKAQDIRDYDKEHGTDYTDQVRAKIKSLKENGEAKAAKALDDMLNNGEIMIDPDPNDFIHHYPDTGKPYTSPAQTGADGISFQPLMFGTTSAKQNFLESTLLHEWIHWYGNHHGVPGNEYYSTQAEINYADRRSKRKMRDGSETDWPGVGRGAKKYQDDWIKHDRRVLIPWIFKGFPW